MSSATLKQKQLINDRVTEETIRCLKIIENLVVKSEKEVVRDLGSKAITAIVKGSPYLEFRPDLEKFISK
jgi:hypothetical protein